MDTLCNDTIQEGSTIQRTMTFDASRVCRVCLEEGALTSVFSGNFTMSLGEMIELCTSVKVSKADGLPSRICSNCIYKLSVAYHFKQQAESSDMRLRQYLGLNSHTSCPQLLPGEARYKDAVAMTEAVHFQQTSSLVNAKCKCKPTSSKKTTRYKRKPESEKLKRGPKPKPKQDHTCYDCNKQFKCRAQLEMHIRTHTGDRPFACEYCSRRFSQKYNLDIHMRVHTGEKPYQCEVCSKRFSAQGNLQTHLKIHSGQRDQICSICKKGFITSSELTRHMAKHRGVKDYKCEICGVAFVQSRDLKSHKLKKHNIGVDAANDASKNYAQEKDYNAQQKVYNPVHKDFIAPRIQPTPTRDPEKKHVCTTCGETFQYLQLLTQHCSLKHSTYVNPVVHTPQCQ